MHKNAINKSLTITDLIIQTHFFLLIYFNLEKKIHFRQIILKNIVAI